MDLKINKFILKTNLFDVIFKNQYFNAKEQFNEIKEDLKKECQQENVEFVELMTRKRIKLLDKFEEL